MSSSPRSPRGFFPADLTPLIVSGWQTNKFDGSISFWEDVNGIQFTKSSIKRKPGNSELGVLPTTPVRGMISLIEYDTRVLYVGTKSNIYRLKANDLITGFEDVGSGYSLVATAGDTVWDSVSGIVSAASITNTGSYNTSSEFLTFTGGTGSGFAYRPPSLQFGPAEIVNGGSGYTANDVLTAVGGTGLQVTVGAVTSGTIWDDGGSVWGGDIVQSSLWSFTNFGTWVLGADNVGPIKIKKNNESFAELLLNKVSGVTITSGGTNYAVNDTVTFTSSASGINLAVKVTDVVNGIVRRVMITNHGSGYTNNEVLTAVTSGNKSGLTLSATVPDCPFSRVKSIDKFGPHILAINYDKTSGTEHPIDVAWCHEDDPDTWVAAADNAAGSLTLREANTELKCIVSLGESKAIYTEDQMFILSYLGSPFYFGYEMAMTSGVGAVSAKSVVSVDRLNFGLSLRGFFSTDGNSVTEIGEEEGINEYVRQNISKSEYPQVFAFHNARDKEVVWCLPLRDTKPNVEITFNYVTGVFSKRAVTTSSAQELGTFTHVITGDNAGKVYEENGSSSSHNTYAETKAHDLGDPYAIKELTSIKIGKTGVGNPKIEIGWASKINDTPTYNPSDSFYADNEYGDYSLRTSGRYLFLKISSDNNSDTWEISNIVVKGRTRGFR